MSAFSSSSSNHYHDHPLPYIVPDTSYIPNTSQKLPSLLEQEIVINRSFKTPTCFSPFDYHPSNHLQEKISTPCMQVQTQEGNYSVYSINEHSSSMVAELNPVDQATQVVSQLDKKRKTMDCKVDREGKYKKRKKCDHDGILSKTGEEKKLKLGERKAKKKILNQEQAPTDYVLVRARRGEATDSHSLAERVRRERIGEKMRLLQSLVPGCEKITGKVLVLDEIIKYVQSLQNEVEFLVMKLASLCPLFDYFDSNTPGLENFCNLEFQLPPLSQTYSMELMTTTYTGMEPISTSLLHQQDQRFTFF
ncbi:hypothetical protein Vadar_014348 [Vaccinium darrowii]|uniref:Uncharacterized protein n=1 Tax=Vaccinium darrowii TaxID=229202 RepID=A0ACB7YXA8_9ERIC|nr:hypothetical protein Vadar_014348 [Vaccinium darrowii]